MHTAWWRPHPGRPAPAPPAVGHDAGWVTLTSRVICAAVVSTWHASRRSAVASGNKRERTSGVAVAMKVGTSSR
jgi:hypothetical protein